MIRRVVACLSIALVTTSLSALEEQEAIKSVAIDGTVLDKANKPIADATVRVFHADRPEGGGEAIREVATVETGDEGRFEFEKLPVAGDEKDFDRNSYTLVITARGYGSTYLPFFEVQREQTRDVTLVKAGTLSGVVTGPDGKPVAGATVYKGSLGLILEPIPGIWSDVTDDEGRFEITDLPSHPKKLGEYGFFYAYHPTAGYQRAKNDQIPAVVNVQLEPHTAIEGRVVDGETGEPRYGAMVSAQGVEKFGWSSTMTDVDGNYRLIGLINDTYNVWAAAPDRTTTALKGFPVATGQIEHAPDLRLVRGGFVVGRLTDSLSKRPVCLTKNGESVHVGVYGPSRPRPGAAVVSGRVQDDGTFRIRVAPGENYVYIMHEGFSGLSQNVAVNEGQEVTVDFDVPGDALHPAKSADKEASDSSDGE